jgi:hypothetical protein
MLPTATLMLKAKRIESSKMYNKIFGIMANNLYVSYAVDRLRVLDAALNIATDEGVSLRDRDRYMKLFLDETRKDPKTAAAEINVNITQNNVNVVDIESQLSQLADRLDGKTADEIIEVTYDSTPQ